MLTLPSHLTTKNYILLAVGGGKGHKLSDSALCYKIPLYQEITTRNSILIVVNGKLHIKTCFSNSMLVLLIIIVVHVWWPVQLWSVFVA